MKVYQFIILVFLLRNLVGFSQKMNLQKFSVKDGLVQSTVIQIDQDDMVIYG